MINDNLTFETISQWLQKSIANVLNEKPEAISITKSFPSFGLDSVVIVTLAVDLENYLGIELDPTVFYEFSSIDEITNWLITDFLPSKS
jgi:acyl carrier protein